MIHKQLLFYDSRVIGINMHHANGQAEITQNLEYLPFDAPNSPFSAIVFGNRRRMKHAVLVMLVSLGLILSACTPTGANLPPPTTDTGIPASKRFHMAAEGYDALLGTYSEMFAGNAAYSGSLLQLWSDSETPNRILQITYLGGGTIPVGTYRAVGSEAEITDPAQEVSVTYTLAQGAFQSGTQVVVPSSDYYFEYYATEGTVTVSKAGDGQLVGELQVKVARYSYYADLSGAFNAVLGK